jgi:two-component sensor histidine kinase
LRGTLARFENGTSPRNFSPCGFTLDQGGPVLSQHPERFYDWIANSGVVLPEVLLVPLYIGGKEPIGTLWVVADSIGLFHEGHVRVLTDLAAFVSIALRVLDNERQVKQALIVQRTLADEMDHRVKNVFALLTGMIYATRRTAANTDEFATILTGRLHALATAHALVRRDVSPSGTVPNVTALGDLIGALLAPYKNGNDGQPRVVLSGPLVPCGERALNSLALVFHELATNAAKYGALSEDTGRLNVAWRIEGDNLEIHWQEAGPQLCPSAPSRSGFGTSLMENVITRQLGGWIAKDWTRQSLEAAITLPLSSLMA